MKTNLTPSERCLFPILHYLQKLLQMVFALVSCIPVPLSIEISPVDASFGFQAITVVLHLPAKFRFKDKIKVAPLFEATLNFWNQGRQYLLRFIPCELFRLLNRVCRQVRGSSF